MNFDVKFLPKAELHCHLDGSLSLMAIRQLAQMAAVSVPEKDEDLARLVTAPLDVTSLNEYLETFAFVRPLLQTKEALSLAAYDVVRQGAEEGVIYTEIRFAPELSRDQGLTALEVVEAVLDGLQQASRDFGVVAKALVCGMRQSDQADILSIFNEVAHLAKRGLVGFDFAGNEADFPTEVIADTLTTAKELGLPFTLHAGECGCVNNIAAGLELGVNRFGHATALSKDLDTLDRFVEQGATAELCLISNLHTKAVASLADYPYPIFYERGVNITINTDNRRVSDTNLTKEYQLFARHFGTTVQDFLTFNKNAIAASFASEDEKAALLLVLEKGYAPFLD